MKVEQPEIVIVANVDPTRPASSGVRAHTLQLWTDLRELGRGVALLGSGHGNLPGFISVVRSRRSDVWFVVNLLRMPLFERSLVHAQYPLFALPWALRGHRRIVCVLHGDNVRAVTSKRGALVGWLYGRCERFAARKSARVVAVSREIAAAYQRRWPELSDRVSVIPLEPDRRIFAHVEQTAVGTGEGAQRTPAVLFVGRLRRDKRPELAVNAFASLRERLPNAELWIVGDGPEMVHLESLARSLGVHQAVVFHGAVGHERIPDMMRKAAVLVVTSAYESGPLVVAEARLCGLRVVSTDVGRVREFLRRFGGIEIVAPDPAEIAAALLRSTQAGSLVPPEDAAPPRSLEAFLAAYAELLDGPDPVQ